MKIVILGGDGDSTHIVYHYLSSFYQIEKILIEKPVSKKRLITGRLKKTGVFKVLGQLFFLTIAKPLIKTGSRKRIQEILKKNHLSVDKNYQNSPDCIFISSVNSQECKNYLRTLGPDLIIVNGTRIISKDTLQCVSAVFINMHVGITPKYRGVYGGYWALYESDPEHCGVTVHKVDEGIDTGKILYQDVIKPKNIDNCCTYPYLQIVKGVQLERKVIEDFIRGNLKEKENNLPSRLYYHPTLLQYLIGRIVRGIK